MPSGTPIPTPTVYRGRLFTGGGFSSREFYCFDAVTGEFQWGASLSDDGPSAAVASGDSIIVNTESCTIFALDVGTGRQRWSHYLGDPMMAAPAVSGGLVFTVYPESVAQRDPANNPSIGPEAAPFPSALEPTYIVACLDADTGKVLWRRWIDGDCLSAPVIHDRELFLATMPGTLYRFDSLDGKLLSAWHARATSAPLVTDRYVMFTCRTDAEGNDQPHEAIVGIRRSDDTLAFVALNRPAPYLDRVIQETSAATKSASAAESLNGIGGGFGGGFNSVPDGISLRNDPASPGMEEHAESDLPPALSEPPPIQQQPLDALAVQQQKAADNIGLGNVSTLQAFYGSRLVHTAGRNFNCMGDEVVCSSASSGDKIWTIKLAGDLQELGGHLAAPPVWSDGDLFVATVVGDVLQIDVAKGSVKARHPVGSPLRHPPVIADGRLYIGTQDGKVVCMELPTD
jgi:outer membrane protein assembly factor BamB